MADGEFTQKDLDAAAAGARKEAEARVATLRSEIAELKAKVGQADSQKSDIDKLTASVQALTDRAAKAEAAVARRDVAEKYNLPKSIAAKLTGTAEDELDREARDWVTQLAEMGVPVKDGKIATKQAGDGSGSAGGKGGGDAEGGESGSGEGGGDGKGGGQGSTGGGGGDAGKNGQNGDGGNQQDGGGDAGKGRSLLGGRPTENLRSGANAGAGGGDAVDPGKLAESILSRGI